MVLGPIEVVGRSELGRNSIDYPIQLDRTGSNIMNLNFIAIFILFIFIFLKKIIFIEKR